MLATTNDNAIAIDRKHLLNRLLSWEPLSESTAHAVATAMLDGELAAVESAALLTAMQMRGESVDELCGFARAVRERSIHVESCDGDVIDTCGTGGSGLDRINISTAAAIVAAAAGCKVAKHGNRAVTGRTGSSDVLQALGIPLDESPANATRRLESLGIAFLHAPHFHPGLRHIADLRRTLGIRTIFNLVGPLANPAGVRHQLIGVSCGLLLNDFVLTLRKLGSKRVLAVHGHDGADEITLTCPTAVCELHDDAIREYQITPEQFGLARCDGNALLGGNAHENARAIRRAMENQNSPTRDVILLNAAAAIYIGGVAASIDDGLVIARESIRSGRALAKLDALRKSERKRSPCWE